jgi:ubiquitin carboxyl-terminal hydrolase 7
VGVNYSWFFFFFFLQTSDILYYEVLDLPLPELQGLKNLKVAFHHTTKDEVRLKSITITFSMLFSC